MLLDFETCMKTFFQKKVWMINHQYGILYEEGQGWPPELTFNISWKYQQHIPIIWFINNSKTLEFVHLSLIWHYTITRKSHFSRQKWKWFVHFLILTIPHITDLMFYFVKFPQILILVTRKYVQPLTHFKTCVTDPP